MKEGRAAVPEIRFRFGGSRLGAAMACELLPPSGAAVGRRWQHLLNHGRTSLPARYPRGMSPTSHLRRAWVFAGIALALGVLGTSFATTQRTASNAPVAAAKPGSETPQPAPSKPAPSKPTSLLPLAPADVLEHVRRSVNWYRDLVGVEQLSLPGVDPLARRQLQRQALTAVHLAFEFGKAAEDILGRESQSQSLGTTGASAGKQAGGKPGAAAKSAAPTLAAQLDRAAADLAAREAELKSQMAALDARLRRARGSNARASLDAQRRGIVAALQLVQQIESNVDQLRRFQQNAISGQGKPPKGLRAQLAVLESSVPELATGEAPGGGPAAAAPSSSSGQAASSTSKSVVNFQPQSAGIVTLIGQWF